MNKLSPPPPLPLDTLLDGRLRIGQEISGQDAFRSYTAFDVDTDQPCVLRCFHVDQSGKSRFTATCRKRQNVRVSGICKLIQFWSDGDVGYLVEEDSTPASVVSLSAASAESLLAEVLAIVKRVSQAGIFHGGIRIGNLRRQPGGSLLAVGDSWIHDELASPGTAGESRDVRDAIRACLPASGVGGGLKTNELSWLRRAHDVCEADPAAELTVDSILALRVPETKSPTLKPASPKIVMFEANPARVLERGEFELRWKVEDAQSVRIEPEFGSVDPAGEAVLIASRSQVYSLTAANLHFSSTSDVSVHVIAGPKILEFSASNTKVTQGGRIELSWRVDGVSMVTLVGVGDFEAHSQVVVTPGKDTAYRLEAHWEGDPVTQQIDVQVEPPLAVLAEAPPVKLEHAEAQVELPEPQSQPEPSRPWRGSRAVGWFVAILVGVTLGYVYVHLTEPGEPRIERFSADPACLVRGEQLTLRWKVHGTASVDLIKEENGKPTSKRSFDGNVTEYRPDPPPQATSTYMLQVGGAESSAAAPYQKLLVKVVSPEEILRGGCSTSSAASPGK